MEKVASCQRKAADGSVLPADIVLCIMASNWYMGLRCPFIIITSFIALFKGGFAYKTKSKTIAHYLIA